MPVYVRWCSICRASVISSQLPHLPQRSCLVCVYLLRLPLYVAFWHFLWFFSSSMFQLWDVRRMAPRGAQGPPPTHFDYRYHQLRGQRYLHEPPMANDTSLMNYTGMPWVCIRMFFRVYSVFTLHIPLYFDCWRMILSLCDDFCVIALCCDVNQQRTYTIVIVVFNS